MTTIFESRPDGEYALCKPCKRQGYGADSWHPATDEFWPTLHGKVLFYRCRACASEAVTRSKKAHAPEKAA